MKFRRPTLRGMVVSAGVVTATAGATFAATLLFGMPFGGDDAAPAGAHAPGVRDRLAICVDVYDPGGKIASVEDIKVGARAAVQDALQAVREHPLWEKTSFSQTGEPVVDLGCPAPPLASITGPWKNGWPPINAPRSAGVVEERGYYSTFVFIVPRLEMTGLVDDVRTIAQEYECAGEVCSAVTDAVYLTPEEIAGDRALVVEKLEEAVHLRVPW